MTVQILPSAWEGLARIRFWVRADFGEDVAQRVTDQILNGLERLERFPDSGSMTPDPWPNDMGFQGDFAFGKVALAKGRTADGSICKTEARPRMVISDRRNVSIFRRVGEDIFVYVIADTHTEYAKVFTEMMIASPDIIEESAPDPEQKLDQQAE